MEIYVVHSALRGKNNKDLVGLKIERAFKDQTAAEDFAAKLSSGEKVVNGELVEIRTGLTKVIVE